MASIPQVPLVAAPEGGYASISGVPDLRELGRRDRYTVRATAAADVGLRTVAASMIAGTMLPQVLNRRAAAFERAQLPFYGALASVGDADLSFPAPTTEVEVRRRRANRSAAMQARGHVEHISFASPFEPLNPDLRESWPLMRRNAVAHAQHWRHLDGPRPTLVVIHGFFASPYFVNGAFLALPWFYRSGFDVLLYTLPFHGRRRERPDPFSGYGFFANGMAGMAEAMGQAIHDLRLFMDYLTSTGVEQIGATGISLGGYTAALLSAVDDRLAVVVPNVPVTDAHALMTTWAPATQVMTLGRRLGGVDDNLVRAAMAYSSPLTYPSRVPKQSRLIITGLGDRLAPPEQSGLLWRHWDQCALYWFPGNHVWHVDQRSYLRRMARFMRDIGFAPDEWLNR